MVVPVGFAVTTDPVVVESPPVAGADQEYVPDGAAPEAVSVTDWAPHIVVGLTEAVIAGTFAQDNPLTSKKTPESNMPSETSQIPIVIV